MDFDNSMRRQLFWSFVYSTGRLAFLIWFTAWVLTRYSILEKIGAWFR